MTGIRGRIVIVNNSGIKTTAAESSRIMDFCLNRSEYFVLFREHVGGIPFEVLQRIVRQKTEEIEESRVRNMEFTGNGRLREIKRYGFSSREELKRYWVRQADEELSTVKGYVSQYLDEEDTLEEDLQAYGLKKREISIGSPFNYLQVCDICYFDKCAVDYSELLINIFCQPIQVGKYTFENLGFADAAGKIWMRTLSSHEYFEMEITEKQIAVLERAGISVRKTLFS